MEYSTAVKVVIDVLGIFQIKFPTVAKNSSGGKNVLSKGPS